MVIPVEQLLMSAALLLANPVGGVEEQGVTVTLPGVEQAASGPPSTLPLTAANPAIVATTPPGVTFRIVRLLRSAT
jgi:hypothetical protein